MRAGEKCGLNCDISSTFLFGKLYWYMNCRATTDLLTQSSTKWETRIWDYEERRTRLKHYHDNYKTMTKLRIRRLNYDETKNTTTIKLRRNEEYDYKITTKWKTWLLNCDETKKTMTRNEGLDFSLIWRHSYRCRAEQVDRLTHRDWLITIMT